MACCGICSSSSDYDNNDDIEAQAERRPLLASDEETDRQRTLHEKLHTYQILRALADGYMPSTDQATTQISKGSASVLDVLNSRTVRRGRLSPQGRRLLQLSETWLKQLVQLMERKNGRDQIQDFIWWARSVSIAGAANAIEEGAHVVVDQASRPIASAATGWNSLQAISALLLESTPFKMFLADLADVGRDVFKDTAAATAQAADAAAKNVDSATGQGSTEAGKDLEPPPADETLVEIADEVAAGASKVAAEAQESVNAKLVENDDGTRERLTERLRAVVSSLSQKPDYEKSVSVLTRVLQRGAAAYLKSIAAAADNVAEVAEAVHEEVQEEVALDSQDQALRDIWSFLTAFGDENEWKALEDQLKQILDKVGCDKVEVGGSSKGKEREKERNTKVDRFVEHAGTTLEEALTDPNFLDDDSIPKLKKRLGQFSISESPVDGLQEDIKLLLDQAKKTFSSALGDDDIHALVDTSLSIIDLLWPTTTGGSYVTTDLASDATTVFVPALVQAVRYIPIPRLEIISPEIDLLLESLILEPATTKDSLLPNHLRVELRNDIDIYPPQAVNTTATPSDSSLNTSVTISINGLSLQAQDLGYVMRLHSGLLYFLDRGVASFLVSDVNVKVDVGLIRDKAERVLALHNVDVSIGKLDYSLRKSNLSCLAWLLQPIIRPILRKTLETQLATSLTELFASVNTEIVFARERLRGARAAGGGGGLSTLQSLPGLVRALLARFQEPVETDIEVSVGVTPSSDSPFEGVFAPGSLVRVWRDEAEAAADRVEDAAVRGWRNEIFDSSSV
ncbi:hypothetical protein F503_00026 [Ophiostoma piceae UAMH 11346]|uniref:HAM1-like N-terminal domain-containing protein n=1 Tax=Ophiostoma piceae (strain UAMH 11346) TaxID=1262450 RepID=S3BWE6_OPHP1|nr:hypothetical protein F503_00026 [Ophiostoma piceae UAMH 11346]